jgi:DNA polymerase III subunit delta'
MVFEAVLGHERPKKVLKSMLDRERLSHALLFAGPRGVGKATMAIAMVKYLFCDQGSGCGTCRSCLNVQRNTHPDLLVITSPTSIGIDELRELRKQVNEYPYEKPRRVIIIDGAETMTNDAANALLKTLEEPPLFNLFILVTHAERDLPLTIRSRCVRVTFGPLARDEIESFFRGMEPDPERAALFASLSCGSVASGLFWMKEEHLAVRMRLADLLIGGKGGFVLQTALAEEITDAVADIPFYLQFILSLLRDMWFFSRTGDATGLVNSDFAAALAQAKYSESWMESSITCVQETMRAMRYNINKWLAFEHLMISIAR